MAPDYKGLNLRRDEIDQYLTVFVDINSFVLRSCEFLDNKKRKRITIGRVGTEDAIIDLHLNNDGTTTIQYKIGKNQELGQLLAQHFYSTIDPGEFITVNYSLAGISSEDIEPIFDELCSCEDDNGNREFEVNVEQDESIRKLEKYPVGCADVRKRIKLPLIDGLSYVSPSYVSILIICLFAL
jgi:hypothetical protein